MGDAAVGVGAPAAWRTSLGEPPDLERVFDRYLEPVHRFLYSRVGNREDAEDLTSEVFLKAARLLEGNRPEASIGKWLFTVARTVLADHWRRYYRTGATFQLDDTSIMEAPGRIERLDTSERAEALVADVLAKLPDRYRQVLEFRFLQGMSIAETAEALSMSPDNVKVTQHRALAKAVQLGEDLL